MTLRQRIDLSRLLNRETSRPITTLQIFKSIDWDAGRSCRELQESALLLRVPRADHLPEVLDHLVALLVAAIVGMLLPVFHVDVGDTADEELEFALVKDVDELGGDELVEAGDEGVELLFDSGLDLPLGDEPEGVSVWLEVIDLGQRTRHIPSCFH
jgi:hypothetical protein